MHGVPEIEVLDDGCGVGGTSGVSALIKDNLISRRQRQPELPAQNAAERGEGRLVQRGRHRHSGQHPGRDNGGEAAHRERPRPAAFGGDQRYGQHDRRKPTIQLDEEQAILVGEPDPTRAPCDAAPSGSTTGISVRPSWPTLGDSVTKSYGRGFWYAHLQHKRLADFRTAALCAEGTWSVVNMLAIIAGRRGRRAS